MNTNHRILLAAFCIAAFAHRAAAIDISETTSLDRYSNLTANMVQHDQGHLLRNGQFQVLFTSIESTFGIYIDEALLGRPIMIEGLYDGYKAAGVIPKWVRSRDSYPIGFISYVVVSVQGGQDPNPIPIITEQPESQRVLLGSAAFFIADATPTLYVTYQWKFRGKPLVGATDFFLMVTNCGTKQAGPYTVEVSTGGKPIVSQKAMLTIAKPVVITRDPKSQTVKAGKSIALRVSSSGTRPFTYQWYWEGAPIQDATNSFYVIKNVQTNNSGAYVVSVSNGLSFDVSGTAVLNVTP